MSEDCARYTATLKAGGGYDAPWLVVRSETANGLVEALNEAAPALTAIKTAASAFAGARADGEHAALAAGVGAVKVEEAPRPDVMAPDPSPAPQQQYQAPPQRSAYQGGYQSPQQGGFTPQPQPADAPADVTYCAFHNQPRRWRSALSKSSGKPYAGFFCVNGCKPRYLQRDGSYT